MAQQVDIIHRLTGRKIVRFPITSDPQVVADTVAREEVRYLVVNDEIKYEYFFPTEEDRWRQVERAYPFMFRLVHRGPGYRVFEVKERMGSVVPNGSLEKPLTSYFPESLK